MKETVVNRISNNHLFFFLFSLFFLLSACATNPLSSCPLEIPDDIAGLVHAGQTNTPEEYVLLDRMDATWLLTTFYWSRIEKEENLWNFDSYDKYVDTAQAAGKKVLGILAYDTSWIHSDGKSHNYIPPDKVHHFVNYVRQTVSHFRGRVDAWCIWNEPNFHFWTGNRDEFAALSRQAAEAAREEDPDVTLLGGAFNRGVWGLPNAYIKSLFESGAMEKADAVAFHPYELNPARTVKLFDKFKDRVAKYGFEDRIWVTEVGYPTGGWYPTSNTEKKFPAHIVKTFIFLATSGAKKIMWYELFDSVNRKKMDSEDFFGLVRSREDYTSKGAEAFRLCAAHLAGTVYRLDLPLRDGLPKSLRSFYFERPQGGQGGGVLVLWKEGPSLRLALHNAVGLTAHDPVSGEAAALPPQALITVNATPMFITWEEGGAEASPQEASSPSETLRLSKAR
jgi:hypothetical protein